MKDCVILPYTFSRIFDIQTVIVTAQKEEFTYLEYLPGLEVDIAVATDTHEKWIEFASDYIKKNYHLIDILFCFGSYDTNQRIIPLYKELRPEGKVILKLDINSGWADKLSLAIPQLREMYENCDLITCESKRMKKLLSEKWPYRIDYVVNGYLEDISPIYYAPYEDKEDVILTVGKIGTMAKANHILVEAFAGCADRYPNWKLKLIGSIEQDFIEYMNEFYKKHPHLKERVILTGKIVDKQLLNEEYKRAKIFAITSVSEGGTPNVFSEAARNGCYIISSDIDAVDEITNWGKCGKRFQVNDIDGLNKVFQEVLDDSFESVMEESCRVIQEYHRRYFNYRKMARKLMHLLELEEQTMGEEGRKEDDNT
jgi:glycosyltransferase involved in cell wall biosynthesis